MNDTVKFRIVGRLKENVPAGWISRREELKRGDTPGEYPEWGPNRLFHATTQVRLQAKNGECAFVEAELPKLIYPDNGHLIKSQEELDRAIARLLKLLEEVCDFDPAQPFELTRIDLVSHVPIAPKKLIGIYCNMRLPRIRKHPIHRPGESLVWEGTHRRCQIYDKSLQLHGREGSISRVEWQLKGEHTIREDFGKPLILEGLQVEECYQVYRKLCLGFETKSLPKKMNWATAIAMGQRANWTYNGVPFAEFLRLDRDAITVHRLMKNAAKVNLDEEGVSWEILLPESYENHLKIDELGPYLRAEIPNPPKQAN